MGSMNTDEMVKVVFKLEKDEDDYPPADYESVWALPVGEGLFQIDNIPFFATEIALGDVRRILEERGCTSEGSHIPGLISVDVPPSVSLAELRAMLDEGEAQERWGYEEACLASPVAR